jgi:hypothetical protein
MVTVADNGNFDDLSERHFAWPKHHEGNCRSSGRKAVRALRKISARIGVQGYPNRSVRDTAAYQKVCEREMP